MEEKKGISRRSLFKWLGGSVVLAFIGQVYFFVRSLAPNVLYEPLKRVKIGLPDMFPEGHKFFPDLRVFIFKDKEKMYSMSSVCTHLGCNVKVVPFSEPKMVKIGNKEIKEAFEFICPCHGSKFYQDGTPYTGPAPTPLPRYLLEISPEDGQIVVDTGKRVDKEFFIEIKG